MFLRWEFLATICNSYEGYASKLNNPEELNIIQLQFTIFLGWLIIKNAFVLFILKTYLGRSSKSYGWFSKIRNMVRDHIARKRLAAAGETIKKSMCLKYCVPSKARLYTWRGKSLCLFWQQRVLICFCLYEVS